MKTLLLILLTCLLLAACSPKTSENNSSQADSVISIDAAVDKTPVNPQINAPSLNALIELMNKQGQVFPSEYCELLGIVPCLELTSCMEVKNIGNVQYFLALTASTGATATNSQAQIILLAFNADRVLHLNSFDINYQRDPVYAFLHNTFFLVETEMKEYEENDAGAMSDTGKPPWIERECRVIFNGKISPLSEYSNAELKLLRNLIFARYGYQFKSDSLKNFFSKYDWYKPISNDVNDQLTDTDKVLIDLIKKEEASKK